jgi:hypothetical protein
VLNYIDEMKTVPELSTSEGKRVASPAPSMNLGHRTPRHHAWTSSILIGQSRRSSPSAPSVKSPSSLTGYSSEDHLAELEEFLNPAAKTFKPQSSAYHSDDELVDIEEWDRSF